MITMIAKSCCDDASTLSFSTWMNLLQQSLLCVSAWIVFMETSMLTLNCFMAISSSAKSCFWSFSSICWAPPKDVLVEDKMLTAEATLTLLNRNIKLEKIKKKYETQIKKKIMGSFFQLKGQLNTCQLKLWALWLRSLVFVLPDWLNGLLRLPISCWVPIRYTVS